MIQVAYLADKYMIPCLANECTVYLRKNMDASNVFGVLKHAQQYANQVLMAQCWHFIDKETEMTLKSSEFMTIERSVLDELVGRDTLDVRELELFKAVDCWAAKECEKKNLKANGFVKRRILGEQIVKNLRFTVMKQSEFMDVVVNRNILTE